MTAHKRLPRDPRFSEPRLVPMAYSRWRRGDRALTPFIAVRSEGIEIRNPHARQMVPWDDIVDITPGYFGLTIRRRTGPDVVAWAVQKSNIARWTRHHTRADDVAEILRKERSNMGPNSSDPTSALRPKIDGVDRT